jgi:protein pelota
MKVYKKDFKELFFDLGIESLDDLWTLSIFLNPEDVLGAKTTRRFRIGDSENSEKKQVFIQISLEKYTLDFDMGILKAIGVITNGFPEEFVNVGEHHSFDLQIGDRISIKKSIFLEFHKNLLTKSLESQNRKNVLFLILDDDSALVAKMNNSQYSIVTELPFKGSGKRDSSQRIQNRKSYFDNILLTLSSMVYDAIVVGGPGFEKENFQKYLDEKNLDPKIKSKFVFTNIASPGISGIRELLKGGTLNKILEHFNLQKDEEIVDEFLKDLSKDKAITYGYNFIKEADDKNNLKLVLLTDEFLKENFQTLKHFLLNLDNKKIEYRIISSKSEPGNILDNMSGIVAFLYY